MADEPEEIQMDGDKVIAFINAVQNMGRILEQVNVIDIKEAFVLGKKIQCIEDIITQDKKWKECISEITACLAQEVKVVQEGMRYSRDHIAVLKQYQSVLSTPEAAKAKSEMREFIELCDRLQKHKEAGTFELVQQILK